ncbi:MAG: hypothetical protein JWM75_2055 [Sphingomonas bacterium]|nr:hypothetical protein [Sphingomonas bacterium]
MPKLLKDNGLTIILMLLFLASIVGQWLSGWAVENEELQRHGRHALTPLAYLADPAFISSVFENWESEFLQMSMYVILTTFLIQRGSAESKDPDGPPRDADLAAQAMKPGAPRALRRGAAIRWLYAHSLGTVLFLLFLVSFVLHWVHSARAAAAEAVEHGERALSAIEYLGDPQLWFESFQNWESEFLSTAVLVVLSIFLRQKESPESKPVAAPHGQTGQ